jgi:hypothetical protein
MIQTWRSRSDPKCGIRGRAPGRQTHGARETPLGRSQLKHFAEWSDGQPATELNFKFYRQAINKIVGISDKAAAFLSGLF